VRFCTKGARHFYCKKPYEGQGHQADAFHNFPARQSPVFFLARNQSVGYPETGPESLQLEFLLRVQVPRGPITYKFRGLLDTPRRAGTNLQASLGYIPALYLRKK
jgi:hypothetical protein